MNMVTRMPPRYLPTLTEVVDPQSLRSPLATSATATDAVQAPALERAQTLASAPATSGMPATAVPDRNALAQQLIQLVRPQLEAELRNIAQELFEAQFSALLPSMHLHIEEAVREAIELALPERPDVQG